MNMHRSALTLILCGILPGLLASCMTGPDYKKPDVAVGEKWSEQLQGGEKDATPEKIQWWTEFTDPTLDSLLARAVASNYDIKIAQSRIREARASLRISQADLWPQLNAAGSYQRTHSPKVDTGGASGAGLSTTLSQRGVSITGTPPNGPSITLVPDLTGGGNSSVTVTRRTGSGGGGIDRDNDLYQAGFDASWELDVFGGVRRSNEAAKADLETTEENSHAVALSIIAEVALNFFDLREIQNRLDIAHQDVQILKDSLDIVRARFEAGLTNELDVKRAEAQLSLMQSALPTLEAGAKQTIHRLGILLGADPGALQDELNATAPLPKAPPEVLVGLPTDLLRRRPDLRAAERNLAAATARIGVATADLFPRFSLTGSFAGTSDTFEGLRLSDNRIWSIGPAFRWPVFDAGRIRANIEVQNARQEQALLAYEQAVMQSLQDVEDALVFYAQEQNRLAELANAVDANQKALDIAQDLYTNGLVNYLNVLDAQRSLFNAKDQLVQSQAAILKNLTALYKALGGGWEQVQAPA